MQCVVVSTRTGGGRRRAEWRRPVTGRRLPDVFVCSRLGAIPRRRFQVDPRREDPAEVGNRNHDKQENRENEGELNERLAPLTVSGTSDACARSREPSVNGATNPWIPRRLRIVPIRTLQTTLHRRPLRQRPGPQL